MLDKTQLQTNNILLASLTDRVLTAKEVAASLPDADEDSSITTGEDVTTEIEIYTTKLAALETQLNALNSELDSKAAGNSNNNTTNLSYFTLSSWTNDAGEYYKIPFLIGQTWGEWVNTILNVEYWIPTIGLQKLYEENNTIKGMAQSGLFGSVSTVMNDNTTAVLLSDIIQPNTLYYLTMSSSGNEPNPYE